MKEEFFKGEKIKEIHIIPYSHHDFAWTNTRHWHIWRYLQCFNEVLEVMEKDKDFTWMIDNVVHSLIPYLENYPENMERFVERVKEGRIAIANGGMSLARSTHIGEESFIRNMVEGKRYFQKIFEISEIDFFFNADVGCGHSQLPQILSLGGHRYYRFWRPEEALDYKGIPKQFQWKGLDGSVVIVSRGTYGGMLDAQYMNLDFEENWSQVKDRFYEEELKDLARLLTSDIALLNYGCDDSRPLYNLFDQPINILGFIKEWNRREKVKLRFSTPDEYFHLLEKKALPVYEGVLDPVELTYNLPMKSEYSMWRKRQLIDRLIVKAEIMASLASLLGIEYPEGRIKGLWNDLFQITGHAIEWVLEQDYSDLYKVALKTEILAEDLIRELEKEMVRKIKYQQGQQYVVFNPLNRTRNEVVKIHITSPFGVRAFDLYDCNNNKIEYQIIGVNLGDKAYRGPEFNEVDVAAEITVPPLGYTTLRVIANGRSIQDKMGSTFILPGNEVSAGTEEDIIDNGILELKIVKGMIKEIKNKRTQKVIVDPVRGMLNELRFVSTRESETWLSSYDKIKEDYFLPERWKWIEKGPIRWKLSVTGSIGDHHARQDIILNVGKPAVDFAVSIESDSGEGYFTAGFPADTDTSIYADIPFGVEKRNLAVESYIKVTDSQMNNNQLERGWPGQFYAKSWTAFTACGAPVGIISEDCSIYYHYDQDMRRMSLILYRLFPISRKREHWVRSMHPWTEGKGIHTFKYSIYAMDGGEEHLDLIKTAKEKAYKLDIIPKFNVLSEIPQGEVPFLTFDKDNVILSAFYKEEDWFMLRAYEACGKQTELSIRSAVPLKDAALVDFMGIPMNDEQQAILVNEHTLHVTVNPWQIINIRWK